MNSLHTNTSGFNDERLQRIPALLERYVSEGRSAGMQALVAHHGQIAHFSSHGLMNIAQQTPVRDDTLFRIFSMTKPVTSVALMSLLERGHLHIDDPVSHWLPACGQLRVLREDGQLEDIERPVTVRQLLTHTAGFSYGFNPTECAVDKLYDAVWRDDYSRLALSDLIPRLLELPLRHQPGTRWHYSIATDICGHLVELISGQPFADFLHEKVFRPLGMHDTGFAVPRNKLDRLATIYHTNAEAELSELGPQDSAFIFPAPVDDAPLHSGGAGLISTAHDYWRFAQMMLNGGELDGKRILGRKTVAWMTRNHVPVQLLPLTFNGIVPQSLTAYGFGLGYCVNRDADAAGTLGSTGDFGWGGLADTYCWVDPQESLVAILLQQHVPSLFHPGRRDFRNAVYQALI